jgi:short chain dehydrogenase
MGEKAMADRFSLAGKSALITGGSRGLGHAMALAFADAGADVAIVSRKLDACEATVREIEARGRRGYAQACHVGRWDEIEPMASAVWDHFGKVDILVNNANQPGAVDSVDLDQGGCRLEIRQLGEEVVFRRLEPAEFDLRGFLAAGRPLEAAIAAELEYDRLFDAAMALSRLFGDGLVAGYAFAAIDIAQPTEALP